MPLGEVVSKSLQLIHVVLKATTEVQLEPIDSSTQSFIQRSRARFFFDREAKHPSSNNPCNPLLRAGEKDRLDALDEFVERSRRG